jgi:hypothetical protein
MLQIRIPSVEQWDASRNQFVYTKEQTLTLEHSLVSISKWESKWCKSFLTNEKKTTDETIDYIKCMTLTQNVNPDVYNHLTNENISQVNKYIQAPMTATTFRDDGKRGRSRERITSELIYYWMIALNIPFECQKWHLNRLLTLIKVCNVKNKPPKKMSKKQVINQYNAINAARRKRLNSTG